MGDMSFYALHILWPNYNTLCWSIEVIAHWATNLPHKLATKIAVCHKHTLTHTHTLRQEINQNWVYECVCVCVVECVPQMLQFVIARVAAATAAKSIGNNATLENPWQRHTAALLWLKQADHTHTLAHTRTHMGRKCAPKTVQLTSRYKLQSDTHAHTHTYRRNMCMEYVWRTVCVCVACNWNWSARKTRYKLKSHK